MKKMKSILIAAFVLVAVIVAIVIVTHLPTTNAEETSAEESTETTAAETVYIIKRDYDDLVRFTVIPTEREVDEDTTYSYASEELDVKITEEDTSSEETFTYEASPDPGKFEYDTSKFRSMMYTLTSMSAISLVEEDATDLTQYGLDQPTATVKLYFKDGTETDLIIGSEAPVDENYYIMTSESNTVYTIGSYVDSLLVRRPIEYRDITLFPTYEDDDIYANINWVSFTDRDDNTIEIQLDGEDSVYSEFNTENSAYVMLQPYQVSGNDTVIKSNILDVVATLELGSIIDDIPEEDFAEYGLDNPAKLAMTDTSGNSVSLLVGDTCPNADYTYCMIEDTNTLITCNTAAFACIGSSYVDYMLRSIWTYNIEDLQSVQIDIDGDTYDMQVTHGIKQNANGDDTDAVSGTLNGQEISETNIRRLYIKCLYFRIIDNLSDEEKEEFEDAAAYATITINLKNESHTLELVKMNDRRYAMRLDGDMEYYCYKKSLTSLENSLSYVLSGDELDFNFD